MGLAIYARLAKGVLVVLMQWLQEIVIDGELMPIRYAERFRAAAEIQGT